MQNVETAVIAAAGIGSRIGLGMPKCMIEVNGQTILSRLISTLQSLVSVVHLVVGYREQMIIEYLTRYHRDVVIVRNPNFLSTNTAYSLSIGSRHLYGKVLYLDGDLLISPESLANFTNAARSCDILVGLTDAKSENAVFVAGQNSGSFIDIAGFSRNVPSPFEWANVVTGPSDLLEGATGYVFERLVEHMPLRGYMLKLAEVDTADDLNAAKQFVRLIEPVYAGYDG